MDRITLTNEDWIELQKAVHAMFCKTLLSIDKRLDGTIANEKKQD